MSGKPLSASARAALLAAMDDPMTDEEALQLIAELVQLAAGLLKIATTAQQEALAPTLIRAGNLIDYAQRRFALATIAAARSRP